MKPRRLLRDSAGSVLPITAAAVMGLVALAGSGIDVSRIYLTKSRLQAACDSGVLAGRKAMDTTVYTTAAEARADAMFNFNFNPADYQATDTDFDATADSEGKLTGVAETTIPMLVMSILGFDETTVEVTCSADIQVPNIDIVFVLDVTGSMNDYIGTTRKIASMRTATIDFYDTIAAAIPAGSRSQIRYGFVPYSQAVNVSELFRASPNFDDRGELPLTHLINNMTVQSRVANFNTTVTGNWVVDTNSTPLNFNQTFISSNPASKLPDALVTGTGTPMSTNDCEQFSNNLSFSIDNSTNLQVWFPGLTSWPGNAGQGHSILYKAEGSNTWQTSVPNSGNYYTAATFSYVSGPVGVSGNDTSRYAACTRRVTHTRYVRETGYKFTSWTYQPVVFDVTNFRAGSAITYVSSMPDPNNTRVTTAGAYDPITLAQQPNQTGMSRSSFTWTGCIEERDTTPATGFAPIPAAATDLDYLTGGTTEALRWRPVMRDLTYMRSGTANETRTNQSADKPDTACPAASVRNLRTYPNRTDFVNYVNTLAPNGYTYLDVGMVWGLRLIAQQGMFSARNLTGPNGGQISRHIIFLTDGEPVSQMDTYSAYGTEQMERRITGSTGTSAATLHARRFQALCDAERGRVGIWAIAFGTSVTGNLQNCADSGRAMQANNTTELRNAFTRIANEVADLRLVE